MTISIQNYIFDSYFYLNFEQQQKKFLHFYSSQKLFFNLAIHSLFLFIFVFSTQLMIGYALKISGVESNRSTNWARTHSQQSNVIFLYLVFE